MGTGSHSPFSDSDAPAGDLSPELEDLLRPTLDDRHDARGFKKPFDPQSLWFASFFGGPITATLLFTLNAYRLGRSRQAWAIGIGFSIVTVVLMLFAVHTTFDAELGTLGQVSDGERTAGRMRSRVLAIAMGAVGYFLQRKRFRLYLHEGRTAAKALLPSILAIIVSIVLSFVLLVPLALLYASFN